ncbi:MAG TPA: hypothetical protein VFH07_10675, partial [Chitinophagaceae bacterium]|jgi:hypothetical protein|nr:hypothetical protein [Chitinophagaceae bacterium]
MSTYSLSKIKGLWPSISCNIIRYPFADFYNSTLGNFAFFRPPGVLPHSTYHIIELSNNKKIESYIERSEIPQYGKKNNFIHAHVA